MQHRYQKAAVNAPPQANANWHSCASKNKFVQTGANVHDWNHTADICTSMDTVMARKEAIKKEEQREANLISHDLFQLCHTYCCTVPLAAQNICLSWLSAQPLCSSPAALNKDAKGGWLLTMESELLDVKC